MWKRSGKLMLNGQFPNQQSNQNLVCLPDFTLTPLPLSYSPLRTSKDLQNWERFLALIWKMLLSRYLFLRIEQHKLLSPLSIVYPFNHQANIHNSYIHEPQTSKLFWSIESFPFDHMIFPLLGCALQKKKKIWIDSVQSLMIPFIKLIHTRGVHWHTGKTWINQSRFASRREILTLPNTQPLFSFFHSHNSIVPWQFYNSLQACLSILWEIPQSCSSHLLVFFS